MILYQLYGKVRMEQKSQAPQVFLYTKKATKTDMSLMLNPNRYHEWNISGARGDLDKRKVLTAAELPKLGGSEVKGIDIVGDGE